MTVAIAAQDLEVRYGDAVALSNVDLSLPAATSLAVVGANGSGKSTLLGAIAGTIEPSNGQLHVAGDRPSLVLQATEVDESLPITVLDTVRLGRYPSVKLLQRFKKADHDAVSRSLERMGVADLAESRLHELSGGQRQRVLIAQGLAQEGLVLLLDEPMTGLDVTARSIVLEVIKAETASGRTVIMTTHSLTDAKACDAVLLLRTTPIALGTPSEVLTEPNLRSTFGHHVISVGDDLLIDDHHVH